MLSTVAPAVDWAPSAANQGAWTAGTSVGVDGGIAQYIAGGASDRAVTGDVVDVTQAPYSADNTGMSDVSATVQTAWDALGSGDVLYFPAGTYHFDSVVTIDSNDSNRTLRGAGPASTTFVSSTGLNGALFSFSEYDGGSDETQTVTGTKTKGTTVLTVSSSAAFTAGNLCYVQVANEEDNTRIQAGAAPTWSNSGFRNLRKVTCRIVAVAAGQVTVDPGLPWDCTDNTVTLGREQLTNNTSGVGLEDFSVDFETGAHSARAISFSKAQQCWAYNVHTDSWTKSTSSGQLINAQKCYKCEIRKCSGVVATPASYSDDGFIQIYDFTSGLIVDNIMVGWDNGVYEFGKSYNTVAIYNYIDSEFGGLHHNAHSSLILYEGNVITSIVSDGYHGSASHNTYYRNWITQEFQGTDWYGLALKRFVRSACVAGNVVGEDGRVDGGFSIGQPNIGNSASTGTAQPTSGDFWADWGMTGTLTTRTSDTAGVVTVSGGDFDASTGGTDRYISLFWNSHANSRSQMTMSSRTGLALTVTGGSGDVLPAQSTSFNAVFVFAGGYQEEDLDVAASSEFTENYLALESGSGSIENGTADTLPNSLVYSEKPAWFYGLAWPPIDPDSPDFDGQAIPAGYRFFNSGNDPPAEGSGGSATAGTVNAGTVNVAP